MKVIFSRPRVLGVYMKNVEKRLRVEGQKWQPQNEKIFGDSCGYLFFKWKYFLAKSFPLKEYTYTDVALVYYYRTMKL